MGKLYVVATPIGNLEDITFRALSVLKAVDLIAAEDTRITRKLLTHFGIRVPLMSYNRHNSGRQMPRIISRLKQADVALVSDAGVPLVSDPGHELVQEVSGQGFPTIPIPGPSALTASLSIAGLPADSFHFLGFMPRTRKNRAVVLRSAAQMPCTLVAFEAPHRLRATLSDMLNVLGDRWVIICRELTKFYEEIFRGFMSAALAHFPEPRGEFVLVISGAPELRQGNERPLDTFRDEMHSLRNRGYSRKAAVQQVTSAGGISRREAYRLWLEQSGK